MPEVILDRRPMDVAALIALWFAIHGGDPAPTEIVVEDETAALIAAALDRQLADRYADVTAHHQTAPQVEERLKSLGIEVLADQHGADQAEFRPVQPVYRCFKVPVPSLNPEGTSGGTITVCIRPLPWAGFQEE